MSSIINVIGAWFVISIVAGIVFGAFCVSGHGEYVKPLQVWWWERIINILKGLTEYRVTLENKVYMHNIEIHGHKDLIVSSKENNLMEEIVNGLTKERAKADARSESLDAQIRADRIKNNPDQQKSFKKNNG